MTAQPIRPSRIWYWVSGAILTGAVVLIVLGVVSMISVARKVDGFQRVPAPGQAEVTFAEPGGYTLYLEGPGISDASDPGTVHVEVTPTGAGPPPSVSSYSDDLSYIISDHEGRAVATIQIGHAGTYLLSIGEPTRPGVTAAAVGGSIGRGIVASVVLLVTATLILIPVGLVVGIVTAVRRRRARRAPLTGAPVLAGWHPDPARRHEYRVWDGARWTEHVSDHGAHSIDPLDEPSLSTTAPGGTPVPGNGAPPEDVQHGRP